MAIKIITFGCRLNTYESEVIKTFLNKKYKDKNIIIFNSCTVTSEAEKQLRQAIRRVRKENFKAIIGVVGCAVQTNGKIYENMEEVDFILGNIDKMKEENYKFLGNVERRDDLFKCNCNLSNSSTLALSPLSFSTLPPPPLGGRARVGVNESKNILTISENHPRKPILITDISETTELSPELISGFEYKTRAFIQIQTGCDNYCTFCATRLARGKSISISSANIVEQINKLTENGYNEIVLTGIDITDYGKRLNENINLGKLIKKILNETDLKRLRLSSIDIADMNDDLKNVLFNEERLMPHIHISLQSGDNTVLKRMARRHTREQVIEFCNEIKKYRKNIAIGADLIAGFPTETEDMHKNSCKLIEEIGLVFGHIFPYSIRENTPAASMEQIPVNIRRIRAKELRDISNKQLEKFTKEQMNFKHKVLIETEKTGRTENYLSIILPKNILDKNKVGDIMEIFIKS